MSQIWYYIKVRNFLGTSFQSMNYMRFYMPFLSFRSIILNSLPSGNLIKAPVQYNRTKGKKQHIKTHIIHALE